jgi:two-component system NarL family sensor kinase
VNVGELRRRLADAEETLRAIRAGEVDAVVVAGTRGPQVFSLVGAEHAYRVLIEDMNEGALTLSADTTILYANACFGRMVKSPLEQVPGRSLRHFLSETDGAAVRKLLKVRGTGGAKAQVLLQAHDGSRLPVQISVRPLAKNGFTQSVFGLVATDLTEVRRSEDMLRWLTHRIVQAQEVERGRVALELDDNVTQRLYAILVRSEALENTLSGSDGSAKNAAAMLRRMLGTTAEEVERIARSLRPGVLDQLGLIAVLRTTSAEFAARTSVTVKLVLVKSTVRLPADIELALYRIFQEALRNIGEHARARHVNVRLRKQRGLVQLAIRDDGIGFDPKRRSAGSKGPSGLGLLDMRERAAYVGGTVEVSSTRRSGTNIQVRIPLSPRDRAHGGGDSTQRPGPRAPKRKS